MRSMNLRLECVLHTPDRSHTELNYVSSLNGYDHTRHDLYLNFGGKGNTVQIHGADQPCNIPFVTGTRPGILLG
jgi:hypothetical protein